MTNKACLAGTLPRARWFIFTFRGCSFASLKAMASEGESEGARKRARKEEEEGAGEGAEGAQADAERIMKANVAWWKLDTKRRKLAEKVRELCESPGARLLREKVGLKLLVALVKRRYVYGTPGEQRRVADIESAAEFAKEVGARVEANWELPPPAGPQIGQGNLTISVKWPGFLLELVWTEVACGKKLLISVCQHDSKPDPTSLTSLTVLSCLLPPTPERIAASFAVLPGPVAEFATLLARALPVELRPASLAPYYSDYWFCIARPTAIPGIQ